jgi:phosphomannomutase
MTPKHIFIRLFISLNVAKSIGLQPVGTIDGKKPPAKLFGTSGIRGTVDGFLTPEFAAKVGQSFAAFLENNGTVLVGRDVRPQSKLIQDSLMSGLLVGGVNVLDCGLVPTPALLFTLKETHSTAGLMVTGSHTPPEISGILFFLSDTGEMDSRGETVLEEIYWSERWRKSTGSGKGSLSSLDIIDTYLRAVREQLSEVGGYKVVVDPGNGATCATLGRALESLGCEVVTINGQPDGRFPSRSPNPEPSTLTQLSKAVGDSNADLGVGTDSDGDRALFATDEGQVLWADLTGALFAKHELQKHGGGGIVTTVNTSSILRFLCEEYGGDLTITRVGPPAIAEAIRSSHDVIFATEESGKYIWPKSILYGDAAIACGKLLQIMSLENMSLEELRRGLPTFHQLKSTIPCADELKTDALKVAIDSWKGAEGVEVSTVDGLKVIYPNSSWFLLRASGTESLLRCNAESANADEARNLLERVTKLALEGIAKAKDVRRP